MTSELQQRKYEKIFDRFDVNGDGQIQQADIDALVEGWAREFDVAPGSAEWRQLANSANRLWQDLLGHYDKDGDKMVSREEWLATHEQPEFLDRVAIPFSVAAFDLTDTNHDGRLSLEEWLAGQATSGLTRSEATAAFQKIDGDGDGYITKAEHKKATIEFYKSDSEAVPGNEIAGRL
jgi:Ca2+-binding EF-hand superfamily protein